MTRSRLRSASGVTWTAEPVSRKAWAELLASADDAVHTQTPMWMDACKLATGGRDASRLYTASDGRRMVLPLLRQGPVDKAARYASMPHGLGFAGLLAHTPPSADDVDVVLNDLAALGGARAAVRGGPFQTSWSAAAALGYERRDHTTHIIDLTPGYANVWNGLKSAMRTKIRRADRSGLVVHCDTSGASINAFYDIYDTWQAERGARRKIPRPLALALGRRAEPRAKFDAVAAVLGPACQIWTASLDDTPIAATIQLTYGAHSTHWRGYSLREPAGRTHANYLLQARMIEDACARGCRTYDMGESSGVESLMEYKARFGAEVHTYSEFVREWRVASRSRSTVQDLRSTAEQLLATLTTRN